MASNTSSVFNDGPAEAPSTSTKVEVDVQVSAPSAAPASDARPAASNPVTPSPSPSADPLKQLAPRMEPALDDHAAPKDSSLRFSRVGGVALEEMKSTLTFRKSCLKRSASTCEAQGPLVSVTTKEKEPSSPVQKNRRRCWECRAKVPLTAVTCRCGYTFCTKHRYAEEHHCRFNFKQAAKRKLEEENPRCVPTKVARIN